MLFMIKMEILNEKKKLLVMMKQNVLFLPSPTKISDHAPKCVYKLNPRSPKNDSCIFYFFLLYTTANSFRILTQRLVRILMN